MSNTIYSYCFATLSMRDLCNLGYASHPVKMDDQRTKNARFCIRIDRPPKNSTGPFNYKIAYAFCSLDDNFSKKVARSICESRIQSGSFLTIKSRDRLNARDLTDKAIKMLESNVNNKVNDPNNEGTHPVKIPNWLLGNLTTKIVRR